MKKYNSIVLLILMCLLISCHDNTKVELSKYSVTKNLSIRKNPKSTDVNVLKYEYGISNIDTALFSYIPTGTATIGVSSIAMNDSLVFLGDPGHSNVKKIDLRDGSITCSKRLNFIDKVSEYPYQSIYDIKIINNKLYVLGKEGKILLLNYDLLVEESIQFVEATNQFYLFYNCSNDLCVWTDITHEATCKDEKSITDVFLNSKCLNAYGWNRTGFINTEPYKISQDMLTIYIRNIEMRLSEKFPDFSEKLAMPHQNNISISGNRLVVFDIDLATKKLILYIYNI